MDKNPDCYGAHGRRRDSKCRSCEYRESCKFYTENKGDPPLLVDRFVPLDAVPYEKMCGVECGDDDISLSRTEVAAFVRHLMNLDDYTVGVVEEVAGDRAHSIRELADKSGVSRQVMARKVAHLMALNPELTLLFLPLMPKLSSGRQRFLRKTAATRRAKRAK